MWGSANEHWAWAWSSVRLVITLLNTMGMPRAPICTDEVDLFLMSKRMTSRPPCLTYERVMETGRLEGRAGERSAAASTSPDAVCAVTAVREAEVVTFCQLPLPPLRRRRVM